MTDPAEVRSLALRRPVCSATPTSLAPPTNAMESINAR